MAAGTMRNLMVAEGDAGQRVDRYLAAHLPELSRTRIQELIEAGLVLVGGKAIRGARKVKEGEEIIVEVRERPPMTAQAEAIPLDVLYEDEDVVVVNKPAGMTVHAGAGNTRGTLVNALLGRGQGLSTGNDLLRPGIVHRLDKETSGAILVAKNDFAHAKLAEAFQKRAVKKTYVALVEGTLKERSGRIELAIRRDVKRRTRMAVHREKAGNALRGNARAAQTDWRKLADVDGTTFVEVRLHTGRTHQIRVHFSAQKHPVVGDTLYGAAEAIRIGAASGHGGSRGRNERKMPPLGRNFLHSARLGFTQPRTGEWIEVRAPLPEELKTFLRKLASQSGEEFERIDAAMAPYL